MKNKIKIYLLIFTVLLTIGATAQNQATEFSLEEAQQYAMKNSFILQNSNMDITSAQKKVWETITMGLPQVTGSANYNAFLNIPVSLLPGEIFGGEPGSYIPVKFGQDYNSDYGISVSQLLFDGSYIVGIGSSKLYLNMAKQSHEKNEIDIRDAVAQAYYYVLIGKENKKVMEENLVNTEKLYEETVAYFDNGFREEQDVDQMKLLVKNAENEILKAEREIKISKVVLKYSMGFDMETEVDLTDDLDNFLNPLIVGTSNDQLDISNHIDYRMSVSNYLASEKLLNLEKAAFLPSLSAFYSYSKTAYGNQHNLFKSSVSWFPSSLVGLQLSVPIFSSGKRISKVKQAQIELDKANNLKLLTEQTLQKDYLTAQANFESAIEKYDNDTENRELAEKIKNKAKIKFQNGISSSTELSQLETQYIQAYGSYIGSALQLLQADLSLKKAKGKL
ncbi:MAG: TolC family protein [Mariniphaga sp.]|nr:TolC family protein [Mariniphaga sp.]